MLLEEQDSADEPQPVDPEGHRAGCMELIHLWLGSAHQLCEGEIRTSAQPRPDPGCRVDRSHCRAEIGLLGC